VETLQRPAASCRLCFVEIEGEKQPVPACTVRVNRPMAVRTDTKTVRQLQRTALNLLLSVHNVACKACPANRKCELQKIARFLRVGLKVKGLPLQLKPQGRVATHLSIDYWPNRCVLCGQCIHACRRVNDQPMMAFAGRGFDTMISFYAPADKLTTENSCRRCTACIEACPVGALTKR
jgi:predicted molibdopterin-dependent oxidoreductase YjgC